jgi:hypothetical protein
MPQDRFAYYQDRGRPLSARWSNGQGRAPLVYTDTVTRRLRLAVAGVPLPVAAEGERRRVEWRRGPLSADARRALEFRTLDLDEGVLYELVEFS